MKNPFDGTLEARKGQFDWWSLWGPRGTISSPLIEAQAKYAAHAINTHDKLVKMLRGHQYRREPGDTYTYCVDCLCIAGEPHKVDCQYRILLKAEDAL